MKWNLLKYASLFLLTLLLFGLFSCARKMIQTKTITETVIRIDTVIKIKNDTVLKKQYITIHDTAILENNTSIARSYFSTAKQKIVLELKGKNYSVPVTVYKAVKKVEDKKEVIPTKKMSFIDKFLYGFFIVIIIYLIWKDRKELFK